ncbi:TPR-like protein [Hymenopellis radicata]|nr:TPR-like protein [Hymenopellis radicata]
MPSVAERKPSVDSLTGLTCTARKDLLRNPQSFRAWWSALHSSREDYTSQIKTERPSDLPEEVAVLIGPLSTPLRRISLQRLTYLYESALTHFPGSFKLWKSYLTMRMSYVLGTPVVKKRAGGKRKLPEMKDALEEEKEDLQEWQGGLDGVVGWEEWRSLVATFERALMYLPKLPRLWLMYVSIFFHPSCPPRISYTHARHTFDRALRTLPPSLHHKIWVRYLLWSETRGGATMVAVYRRYLAVDPSVTEYFTKLLLDDKVSAPRPLEAAKLLLSLARKAARGEYTSPEGKSPYQLLGDWLDVVEAYPEEVGLDVEETVEANDKMDTEAEKTAVEEDENPQSPRKLNIEQIIQNDGLARLATYWTKRGEFDRAKDTFESGISTIFDAYAEFCESLISAMMEGLADEEDEEEAAEMEAELDKRMKEFEELMDRRPFLVNEVLIRRNPHDVQEWEKRVAETYTKALETVNPRKATANLHRLYVNFAKYYEEGGASGTAEPDLDSARKILEKATKVNFKAVEDLAEIWCEWAELEIRQENYDESIRVMQRAAAIPKNTRINYHDHTLSAQARLFKSLKLWSFYVDLEESIGSVETAKTVYDKILELRIANAQIIVNYAAFLEENDYFEESFKVYERGVELFTFPISFEIWNIYLSKFIKRFGGSKLERARDLFEQALEKCPAKSCKPLFLMYAQMEEDHGLAKRAMSIFDRATQVVQDEDKFEMFSIYIAKATANYGLPATRPIYERALEVLPNAQAAEMCLRFAVLERKLGEIDRAQWNSFEIDTGSEDTFREMLRIKRSVQAQFNTEASYLAAQTMAARQGTRKAEEDAEAEAGDAMAMADKQAGGAKGPAFVAAKQTALPRLEEENGQAQAGEAAPVVNTDEIHISDEEDM